MLPFFLFFGMFWNVLEWWLNPSNVPMKAPASEGPYSHKRLSQLISLCSLSIITYIISYDLTICIIIMIIGRLSATFIIFFDITVTILACLDSWTNQQGRAPADFPGPENHDQTHQTAQVIRFVRSEEIWWPSSTSGHLGQKYRESTHSSNCYQKNRMEMFENSGNMWQYVAIL